MRPYLVLLVVALVAVSAFGQDIRRPVSVPYYGYGYGYGPFAPVLTTPMISLQTVSPNPVGATNATTGLVAGATNSTLSQIEGSTSSDHTVAVWYQGGAPLTTSDVNIWPEPLQRDMHMMRGMPMTGEEHGPREHGAREEGRASWTYFTGPEPADLVAASGSKGTRKHTYTNEDVTRQNDNNGNVKYDGKTEKLM